LSKWSKRSNTSSQVQQYTIDEYKNKFEELKEALANTGFDVDLIAFRENEDEQEWDVREIVQRMACFLKDRWRTTQPASMYRSKGKALDLYTNESSRDEFRRLFRYHQRDRTDFRIAFTERIPATELRFNEFRKVTISVTIPKSLLNSSRLLSFV